ncbi:MAG: GMC oxidoreductase [Anaerolineales bacterium]
MFIDGCKIEKNTRINADVCIIGSGPAGLTIASEFANQDFKVVVLESGGRKFRHPTQWLYIAKNVGRPYFDITYVRHRMVGGSSYKWSGVCRPLDEIDFEKRDWLPNSGWPFGLGELSPYYDRACRYMQLPTSDFSTRGYLTAGQAEIQNERIETKIYQHSPPTDFNLEFADRIAAAPNVDIIYHANAVNIQADQSGHTINFVQAATLTGRKFQIHAGIFVLACGGIENPRILLASNNVHQNGLGNQNDLVGRYFNEHVTLYSAALSAPQEDIFSGVYTPLDYEKTLPNLPPTATFSLRQEAMRAEQLLNARAEIVWRPTYKFGSDYNSLSGYSFTRLAEILSHNRFITDYTPRDFMNAAANPARVFRILRQQLKQKSSPNYSIALRLMGETVPNPDSRITLSNRRDFLGMPRLQLDWRLTEQDRLSFFKYQKLLIAELRSLGFNIMEPKLELDSSGWPYAIIPGKHHNGTTRMHVDPKQGVVDPDCKVHDISNLYIGGSSVFPTSGSANPTFTITAMAIRLADHIKSKINSVPNL